MRLLDYLASVLVGYLVVATIAAGAFSLVVTRAEARRPVVVHRMTHLPPVPPLLPRDYEPQPPVWTLSGDALDERMRDALGGEDSAWLLNLLDEAA